MLLLAAGVVGLLHGRAEATRAADPATPPVPRAAYGRLPLTFEANCGQTDSTVQFLARGSGFRVFLTRAEAVLAFNAPAGVPPTGGMTRGAQKAQSPSDSPRPVIRMALEGANPDSRAAGLEQLPGTVNYFRGSDPDLWQTDVPTYAKVRYEAVYPRVDVIYYGNARQLEYDFVVAPGGDPDAITLDFEGADSVEIDAGGDLVLTTPAGPVRFQKPIVYQEMNGTRLTVAGTYVRKGLHRIGFRLAGYDTSRALVIDPVLNYATYLGGTNSDWGQAIGRDSSGAVYVVGSTMSADFPTSRAIQPDKATFGWDAFIAKLTPDGAMLEYASYLGGQGDDHATAVAVDSAGAAYLTGFTSGDFPVVRSLQDPTGADAFVAKLTPDGDELAYSTYLGGSESDMGTGIAVDGAGAAYVSGWTSSFDFPTVDALQPASGNLPGTTFIDAFVAKLAPDGMSLEYATYLGGSADDRADGIAVDAAGSAYVTGETGSSDFPTLRPLQAALGEVDAFVTKLTPDGALDYSTYLGGSGFEEGFGIAVDAAGSAYVAGQTLSSNFPTVHPLQPAYGGNNDAFVARLSGDGMSLVYATYLGGSDVEIGRSIAVDSTGAAYVTGLTASIDFPVESPTQSFGGDGDAFVAKLMPDGGSLMYSSFLGGSGFDDGRGLVVDEDGTVHVTGLTTSIDFPVVRPLQAALAGGTGNVPSDGFVVSIAIPGEQARSFAGTPGAPGCHGQSVSALVRRFGALDTAATALGFPHVRALQDAIRTYCEE